MSEQVQPPREQRKMKIRKVTKRGKLVLEIEWAKERVIEAGQNLVWDTKWAADLDPALLAALRSRLKELDTAKEMLRRFDEHQAQRPNNVRRRER